MPRRQQALQKELPNEAIFDPNPNKTEPLAPHQNEPIPHYRQAHGNAAAKGVLWWSEGDVLTAMRTVVLLLLVACAAFSGLAQVVPDTPANRLAAAKRYLKAMPPATMVADSVNRVVSQVPPERRDEFKQALSRVISSDRIEKITLEAVTKHFTVKEINALTAFYGSPEGRSITRKFGAYIADVMPAIQEELAAAVEEIHKEVQ